MMESLLGWLTGRLSTEARIFTALAPALVICAYFLIGFAVYTVRYALRGPHRDPEMEKRAATPLTGMFLRLCFAWLMQPIWTLLVRSGIPATAVTTLSVLLATGSGVALGVGRFALGGWLYIFSGILDYMDGRLARLKGADSKSGAALDSILDRYADSAVLIGLAWYYRDSWVLFCVLAAMAGSSIIPYIRAKGEVVGITMTVGVMQRAERIVYLGVGVAVSPVVEAVMVPNDPHPIHRLAVVSIVLLAVSSQLTAFHRLVHLLYALDGRDLSQSWLHTDKGVLARRILVAIGASVCDFAMLWTLLELNLARPAMASFIATMVGAAVAWSAHRFVALTIAAPPPSGSRFTFVALTSALLNAGGVVLLLQLPGIAYPLAWLLARGAIFLTWNYPLHRNYVFSASMPTREATAP